MPVGTPKRLLGTAHPPAPDPPQLLLNSYVVLKAASVATSAAPQVPSLPPPAKARRAGPPIFNFPTPKATANTLLADSAAPGTRRQRHRQLQMQLQMLRMQMMRLQGLWQFPQMQLLSYLTCLAKQKASRSSLFAEVPQSQDDEAAAKCQFCFERLDAAEPWLIWVKLCVGSFVCCI